MICENIHRGDLTRSHVIVFLTYIQIIKDGQKRVYELWSIKREQEKLKINNGVKEFGSTSQNYFQNKRKKYQWWDKHNPTP